MTDRPGKTTRMIEYAIGAARQGREIAIIANTENHRKLLHQKLLKHARAAGCKWVVGDGINGGAGGNIEVYHVAHYLVMERGPGNYIVRGGTGPREVLVDHEVLEDRYQHAVEHYLRWI